MIIRTSTNNDDFQKLVQSLDQYLRSLNGEDNDFFAQYNKVDFIQHVIVIYQENIAVACGAIKAYNEDTMEIKRMYTNPAVRGNGYGSQVLNALEEWSRELGYKRCILEMGKQQVSAEYLYRKNNYKVIPNYGQYQDITSSLCFEKIL